MTEAIRSMPSGAPAGDAGEERAFYSKDYWDLVLEQLVRRRLFVVGLSVLMVLYGLAIFAPLIANDRPYKLVAVDYGRYGQALEGYEVLGNAVIAEWTRGIAQGDTDWQALAQAASRSVEGTQTRAGQMGEFLPPAVGSRLLEFPRELERVRAQVASKGAPSELELAALEANLAAAIEIARPVPAGAPPDAPGQSLLPKTSYPLFHSLGGGSVFLMGLWLLMAAFPLWNRIWNRAFLGGDRERIRRARVAKWALILGLPSLLAGVWLAAGIPSGSPFDTAPYKLGLTRGTIVPSEAPLLAPLPTGYAEIHGEEGYRPPTYLKSSWVDSDGRYLAPERRAQPDPQTGYLPPPTPVEVRFGEPWPNAPLRHFLGTDELGRDFLVRMLWGGRVSLAVGILSAVLLTVIGVVMGSLAGYFGGWVDTLIMRLIEILQSIPAFFLILATLAFTDPEVIPPIIAIVLVIAFVRWTGAARLVRGEFLRLREQEFVLAARSLGFSSARTIFKHVLPNALSPVLVSAAFAVASGILTESAVSYLGFGVKHPQASWGSLINESKSADHWWVQVFPGLLIFLTVTCYNLVGDAVRDALDPKSKV